MQSIRRKPWRLVGPAHNHRPACARAQAFTIIELVIVVLIMSIFAATAAPKFFDSLLFHRVESAARRVKADLDYARQRARLTSATQTVTFASTTYTLVGAKSLDRPNAAYTVDLTKSPLSLDSATANFAGVQTISFDGYGTPSSGGTVVLRAKNHQCTVTVESITGATTITSSHTGGRTAQAAGN